MRLFDKLLQVAAKAKAKLAKESVLDDKLPLGDKWISVPRLTPEMYKKSYDVVYRIPRVVSLVLTSDDRIATALGASEAVVDEMTELCAKLSGLDVEYLEKNADVTQIVNFVLVTVDRTDWVGAIKKYRALVAKLGEALARDNADQN